MQVRAFLKTSLLVVTLLAGGLFAGGNVSAESSVPDLSATVKSSNPTQASVVLKNISAVSCQVATTAQGTVAVTKVVQNGKVLQPIVLDAASDDDIGYLLQSQLKTIAPGESATVPLQVFKLSKGYVLRSTAWSSDAGTFASEYAIQANQPLQLELNYSLPITPDKGAPACGAVLASTINGGMSRLLSVVISIIGFIILIALLVLAWWLLRKRKHGATTVGVVALLLMVGVAVWAHAPRASADIVVPPSMQAAFDTCMGTLNANRDITGPVLDVINNPANHIEIVYTTGGSDMTGYDHTFTIYWNPNDRHPYGGSGGNADPCTTLYHEMYHALDMSRGTFSRDDCAGSGIETKEVVATRAQNLLRVRLGLPPRSHYGSRALPSGDCAAPARDADCTGEHCADTNGDPHLRTFDGLRYDFQAAGEFTAVRSQSGDYEIQVRQQPWSDSRYVALNTAIALKIGADRLEIRSGAAMQLLLNGKATPLVATTLPGGGKLDLDRGVVVLTWPDGSVAYVRAVGVYGLALSVQASNELAGKLQGLLGDADGNPANDLHARGSTKAIQPTYAGLYPAFADSWRITDKTSLFTYAAGKTTASYTLRGFPDELKTPKNLPNYAAAESFCKSLGVQDVAVLANCALDVALTGRPEFARAAANSQAFASGANFGGTTWKVAIAQPGDKASLTFDGKAGEKVFVQIPQTTLPSQCDGLALLGPDGVQVANGCIINGSGEIDGTVLPATGQYTIVLSPATAGTATVRLLRITDKQGTIVPDGAAVTAHIDKPGVVARYTFAGQAGQRVYLDIPNTTLPSQCGIVQLLGADGQGVSNGCIINGSGNIDTAVLPATGQYTIVLDPNDTATGTAQLKLTTATLETRPITLDGATLTANLAKPGSVAVFTFTGVAGQRVYVDLPKSDLPSECGLLVLRAPDDSSVAAGCVINHVGNLTDDGVVLPTSGQYTITLDPGGGSTGKTTIRVRTH